MQSNVLSNSNMALAQQQQMQAQMQQQQQQQPQQQIVQMNGRAFTAVPGPNGMMMLTAAPGAVGASIGSAPVRRSGGSTYDDDPLGEPIYGRTRRRSRSRASARSGDGSRPASRASSTRCVRADGVRAHARVSEPALVALQRRERDTAARAVAQRVAEQHGRGRPQSRHWPRALVEPTQHSEPPQPHELRVACQEGAAAMAVQLAVRQCRRVRRRRAQARGRAPS